MDIASSLLECGLPMLNAQCSMFLVTALVHISTPSYLLTKKPNTSAGKVQQGIINRFEDLDCPNFLRETTSTTMACRLALPRLYRPWLGTFRWTLDGIVSGIWRCSVFGFHGGTLLQVLFLHHRDPMIFSDMFTFCIRAAASVSLFLCLRRPKTVPRRGW